jgi:peptidoglycan/xylan/chitin deacetylase (PgdA/CDA1 family)
VVALTFDAGANADGVASILATLTHEHVPATMFLTGDFVEHFKTAARRIVAAGMRIGDHSISHPYFTKLTDAQIRMLLLSARNEIMSVTGQDPWPWFRFPYGDRNSHTIAVVNSTGFVPLGWTVDTLGWKGASAGITATSVISRVLAHLQPGEIVLMHCGSNPTDHSTLRRRRAPDGDQGAPQPRILVRHARCAVGWRLTSTSVPRSSALEVGQRPDEVDQADRPPPSLPALDLRG